MNRSHPAKGERDLLPISTGELGTHDLQPLVHTMSIVVPVYQGEKSLERLIQEVVPLTQMTRTTRGNYFKVTEVILVHDGAIDNSEEVMMGLAERYSFVTTLWLSRNYGQHPATLAGMASTTGDWVVTMDEDGQQNPVDIGNLLDHGLLNKAQLVYAKPVNQPPHGWVRNLLSSLAKAFFVFILDNRDLGRFNSFRLIQGEIARSLAAYCGPSVFLDGALSWIVARSGHCGVIVRHGSDRPSGYNFRKLCRHFWRLVLTSGTKPLRIILWMGLLSINMSLLVCGFALWEKLTSQVPVQGWTSLFIVTCFFFGCILLTLGVIAEYLGATLTMTMGKPLYLVVSRPHRRAVAQVNEQKAA